MNFRFNKQTSTRRLVFIDDFFRGAENGLQALTPGNRRFLHAFFGVAAERLGWATMEISPRSQGGLIDVAAIMRSLELPNTPQGWAAACTADLGKIESPIFDVSPDDIFIGWGLPPSILSYIDKQGATFIDIELHSVRFCQNLNFMVRTNNLSIQKVLQRHEIDEEFFWSAAAGIKGYFARRGKQSVLHPELSVGLLIGQMDVDLAVVKNGRMVGLLDYLEEIRNWAREVDVLAVRPHPAQKNTRSLQQLVDKIPNATLVNYNTYALLCASNLSFVGALSSGVLVESEYLNVNNIRRLFIDDRNNPICLPEKCSSWMAVRPEIASLESLSSFFKKPALIGSLFPRRDDKGSAPVFERDVLDTIIGYRWGLDYKSYGIPQMPTLTLEAPLNLGNQYPGAKLAEFGSGWSPAEDWGPWTVQETAYLAFSIDESVQSDPGCLVELSFLGHVYTDAEGQRPIVSIRVNNQECKVNHKEDRSTEWTIVLDAFTLERRTLLVTVLTDNQYCSQGSSNENHDSSAFGVRLRFITLRMIPAVPKAIDGEPVVLTQG